MKKSIKIKLKRSDHLKEYVEELERWEGEGGTISDLKEILDDIDLPLRPGETLEVVDGQIVFEDDDYFYEATLKLMPEGTRID